MGEPVKDLGILIDELIAIRVKQYGIMDSVSAAYPAPELKELEAQAVTIRMKISRGQFRSWSHS